MKSDPTDIALGLIVIGALGLVGGGVWYLAWMYVSWVIAGPASVLAIGLTLLGIIEGTKKLSSKREDDLLRMNTHEEEEEEVEQDV